MITITRRGLLAATAVLPIAACNTTAQTVTTIAAQDVSDAQLIANGLAAELPAISTLSGLSAATLADVTAKVKAGLAAGAQLVAGMAASAALPLVQQIEADVASVESAVGSVVPLPGNVAAIVTAAEALLPVVLQAVGLFAAPRANGMSPDQARAILRRAA